MFQLATRVGPPAALAAALAGCAGGNGSTSLPGVDSLSHTQSVVQTGTFTLTDANSGSTSFAPLALTWPKGAPAAGDVLVACSEAQWQTTPQTPTGWTALFANSAGTFGTALFYKIAGSAEPATVPFALATPYNISAAMVRISGAAATPPLWSHVANHNSGTIATHGIVPTAVGMLPLACFAGVNDGTHTLASGWSLDTQVNSAYSTLIEQRLTTSADTTTPIGVTTTDAAGSSVNDAYGVLLAPAATTPTPTPTPTPIPTPTPTPVPAAFALRDANSGSTSFAPLALAWPKGAPTAGDLLLACSEAQWQTPPQTPAGWTALFSTSAGTFGTALFYKIAGAAEPATVDFSLATPYNIGAAMVRIGGAAATPPLWSHVANHNSGTIATQAIVPTTLGMLPLACFAGVNDGTRTLASGWSLDTNVSATYSAQIEQRLTTTVDTTTPVGVTTTDATNSSVNDAYGILVAPAAAVGPTPPPGAIALAPAAVAFSSLTAAALRVTATQAGNTSFSAGGPGCAKIASIASLGSGTFNLAPLGVGSCTFTISGSGGHTATLPVTVTTTSLSVH